MGTRTRRDYREAHASRSPLTNERFQQPFGRPGNHVAADEFADLLSGLRARFDGCSHAADIALHDRRYQRSADTNSFDDLHIRGFRHCICRLNQANQAFRFNQTNRTHDGTCF